MRMHITFAFVTVCKLFVLLKYLLLFHSHHWPIHWSLTSNPVQTLMPIDSKAIPQWHCAQLDNAVIGWEGQQGNSNLPGVVAHRPILELPLEHFSCLELFFYSASKPSEQKPYQTIISCIPSKVSFCHTTQIHLTTQFVIICKKDLCLSTNNDSLIELTACCTAFIN